MGYLTTFFKNFYNLDTFLHLDTLLGTRISDEVVQDSWNVASKASPTATLACVATWLTDFRPDLAKITVPSLIIQGTKDQILPFESTGQRLEKLLTNTRLVEIDGAPHGLLWTHHEELNPPLLDFLRGEGRVGSVTMMGQVELGEGIQR